MNSKGAFKSTLQVMNPGRPVFVPFIYGLAARIEQVTLNEMVTDPTYYANLLEGAYKLLKPDAIIINFDPSLEAEIFGCQVEWQSDYELPVPVEWSDCNLESASIDNSSRIPIMLEATRRLVLTQGKSVAIVGVVTGPCSLARNIAEHARLDRVYPIQDIITLTGNQLTKLVKSICESKVDALIIREDLLGEKYREELLSQEKLYTGVYTTIFNLTRFYNASTLVMVRTPKLEEISELGRKLRPNGIIISGRRMTQDDLRYLKDLSDSQKVAIGISLPIQERDAALAQLDLINGFVNEHKPRGFFYTSDGEVPPDIPLEEVQDLAARIKGETGE